VNLRIGHADAPTTNASGRVGLSANVLWRPILALTWPPAMVAAVYLAVGRFGFFPTDDGLVLAYSYRLLQGQVPHRDFISPRPLGSAFIHLLDFAIPGPLFEVSRVIALCEYVAYAVLFAWLVYEVAPWRWGLAAAAAAAWSVLVNLNRFPLMAWYTVDGLLLVALGLLMVRYGVRRESWRIIATGFLVLGLAALTKQSFAPATALGWLLLVPRMRTESWRHRLRDLFVTGMYGAAPLIIFAASISALGGAHQLRSQLLGSPLVYGLPLVYPWLPDRDLVVLVILVVAAGGIAAGTVLARRGRVSDRLGIAMAFVMTAVVFVIPLADGLGLRSDEWGVRLFWMAVAYCVVASGLGREADAVGLALIGTAWMASLSYSFFYPNLVGGTLGVYLLQRVWSGATSPKLAGASTMAGVAALLVLATTAAMFYSTRSSDVYLDRPSSQLTAGLSNVSPAFGDIRTNPQTDQYLEQMATCVKRFPARYVAILPENAGMYPVLGLRNPFPIDWIWPYDIHGSEGRILATTDQMNRDGDYLVLFQTIDEPDVVNGTSLPNASPTSTIPTYTPLTAEIYARLNGVKTTCGSFLVVYSAPSPS
jgi:hypothetical protein